MVKNSDPVVLFSNLGYLYNFSTDLNGVNYEPGNTIEYALGVAYALNYNLAINGSFEHKLITETKVGNIGIPGSRLVIANFKTGLTYAFTNNLSLDVAVGTGLTEDSPDLSITVSLPYTF
jgi:long-subunit fatty acid transport protein